MTIKTTLGARVTAAAALSALLAEKLPIAVAVKVSLLTKKFNAETKTFDEQRLAIFEDLGVKDEAGETYTIAPEKKKEFAQRLDELASCEVTLPVEPIKLAALGEKISVSAGDLMVLEAAGLLILEDQDPASPPKA